MRILTSHLESYPQDGPYRASQMLQVAELAKECPCIFVGDTNIEDPNELNHLFQRGFKDVYAHVHKLENSIEDYRNIKNATFGMLYPNQTDPSASVIKRIDYVLAQEKFEAKEAILLGTEPIPGLKSTIGYNGNAYPSDHRGIWAYLTFNLMT